MNLLKTKAKLISAAIIALFLLGGVADAIAVTKFGFEQGNPFSERGSTADSNSSVQMAIPTATLKPTPTLSATPTPTPVPPLGRQLEVALSVSITSERDTALLIAAEDAVLERDYWTAIRAASATPSNSAQARNLTFVVRCAIEDGLYDLAADAAGKTKIISDRDRLKIEVIEARRKAEKRANTEIVTSRLSRMSRETMNCFGTDSE